MGKQRVEHVPQAGQLPSFSACCGSSGGCQPGLLVAVPGALCLVPGLCHVHQKLQACKKWVGKSLTLSWSRHQAEIAPAVLACAGTPQPCSSAWPHKAQGGEGNGKAACPHGSWHWCLLQCTAAALCSPPVLWSGPTTLPRAAKAASTSPAQPWLHGLGRSSCRQCRGGPAARGIHCLLSAVVPQGPTELLHVVAQSWALTPRESQQSSTGIVCCVEELKQVVPLAGHKTEASYRCLLRVTSGPSYGHGYGKELGWMEHPGLFSSRMSL